MTRETRETIVTMIKFLYVEYRQVASYHMKKARFIAFCSIALFFGLFILSGDHTGREDYFMKSAITKINDLIAQVNAIKEKKDKDLSATQDTVKATETELDSLKAELQDAIDNANADRVQKLAASIAAREAILQAMRAKAEKLDSKTYMTETEFKEINGKLSSGFEELERDTLAKIAAFIPDLTKALNDYEALRAEAADAVFIMQSELYKDPMFEGRTATQWEVISQRNSRFVAHRLPVNAIQALENAVKNAGL